MKLLQTDSIGTECPNDFWLASDLDIGPVWQALSLEHLEQRVHATAYNGSFQQARSPYLPSYDL